MFKKMLPPNLRKLDLTHPYPWRMLLEKNSIKHFDPPKRKPKGFIKEYSASFQTGPIEKALEIAEGSKIELAFIFNDAVEVSSKGYKGTYPEVMNFVAKMHYIHPAMPSNLEELITQRSNDLAIWISKLRRLEISEPILRVMNPSCYATPLSIMRIATARARSLGHSEVTQDHIEFAIGKIEDNILELQKISEEYGATIDVMSVGGKLTMMEAKVLNAVRKLEEELGETAKIQIKEKTGFKDFDLDNIIESLLRKGYIYEPKLEYYKSIPF